VEVRQGGRNAQPPLLRGRELVLVQHLVVLVVRLVGGGEGGGAVGGGNGDGPGTPRYRGPGVDEDAHPGRVQRGAVQGAHRLREQVAQRTVELEALQPRGVVGVV